MNSNAFNNTKINKMIQKVRTVKQRSSKFVIVPLRLVLRLEPS